MQFKYAICYPDKEEIDFRSSPISGEEVIYIARNYQWIEQLNYKETLDPDELFYSPSLEFTCIDNNRSFTLTAIYNERGDLEFSLWYYRPKMVRNSGVAFEKMEVDDIWAIKYDDAIMYLDIFVKGEYSIIENLYR